MNRCRTVRQRPRCVSRTCAPGDSNRNRVDDRRAPSRLSDGSPFEPSCKLAPDNRNHSVRYVGGAYSPIAGTGVSHDRSRVGTHNGGNCICSLQAHTSPPTCEGSPVQPSGQMVGIPVPTPCVLDIRESELWDGKDRFAFGTSYEGHSDLLRRARLSPTVVSRLVRWPSFLGAIAFDEWIANEDRTPSNLLFVGGREFLLIDREESLPNYMNKETRFRNGFARHLIASESGTPRQSLAQRVKEACAEFGQLDFRQLETAALLGSWKGNHEFGECVRLLQDRVNELPAPIEEEFQVGQAQLLA